MKLNVKGEYVFKIPIITMFLNTELKIHGNNLITSCGESFFMNRMINDNFNPIQYICLGSSSVKPQKNDMKLGTETIRRKCVRNVNLKQKQIILTCSFGVGEIYGTTEIGVANDNVLISHDVYTRLDDTVLTPTAGDVEVEYIFNFSTGGYKTGWSPATDMDDKVYYIYEPNPVALVYEANGSGYNLVNSKDILLTQKGAYYYDDETNNLYIHCSDDRSPESKEIIVNTK